MTNLILKRLVMAHSVHMHQKEKATRNDVDMYLPDAFAVMAPLMSVASSS